MSEIDFKKLKKVYFIGIGGIGISAIARMMVDLGKNVSGSDVQVSRVTEELQKLGVKIYLDHKTNNLPNDVDLVIYTTAISGDNLELIEAKKLGIKTLSYPQMLGEVSKNFYTIAVSGTHGKTTTTAMLAQVCIDAGLKPNVIVGSLLSKTGSNYVKGNSKYFIIEACEYKKAFLNLNPQILIINNLEEDHLDYYRDLKDIQNAFSKLVSKIPKDGFLICDIKDKNILPVLAEAKCKIVDSREYLDLNLKLKVPGEHNLLNAAASLATSSVLEINENKAKESLKKYKGVWRRFELKGETKGGLLVYDDYAHHPTEVKKTLTASKDFFKGKIFVIFQPHLYSRTKKFLKEFSQSFNNADEVLVLPIYSAREKEDKSINSGMLVEELKKTGIETKLIDSFDKIIYHLNDKTEKGDTVITIGAGDVYKIGERMLKTNYE